MLIVQEIRKRRIFGSWCRRARSLLRKIAACSVGVFSKSFRDERGVELVLRVLQAKKTRQSDCFVVTFFVGKAQGCAIQRACRILSANEEHPEYIQRDLRMFYSL
jgi:hypothetical protein